MPREHFARIKEQSSLARSVFDERDGEGDVGRAEADPDEIVRVVVVLDGEIVVGWRVQMHRAGRRHFVGHRWMRAASGGRA